MRPSARMVALAAAIAASCAIAVPAFAHDGSGSPPLHPRPDRNQVAARADAAALLKRQALPTGTTRTRSDPSAGRRITRTSPWRGGQLVSRWRFYRVPADDASALEFLDTHHPQGGHSFGAGSAGSVRFTTYSFAPVPRALTSRQLTAWWAPAKGGGFAIAVQREPVGAGWR